MSEQELAIEGRNAINAIQNIVDTDAATDRDRLDELLSVKDALDEAIADMRARVRIAEKV